MNIGSSLNVAKTFVASKAGRQLLKGQKHSPTILFGAGVVGVVSTAVLASKASLKLEEVINKNEEKHFVARKLLVDQPESYTAADYTKDSAQLKVRLVVSIAKLYAPTVIVGAATICAFGGSHVILTKRNAGLMAAYAALDKSFGDYRERVVGLVGTEKERELRYEAETREVAKDTAKGTEVETLTTAGIEGASLYAKFFSKETSNSWSPQPDYNLVFLRSQQQWANDKLQARGHVFLNEVYDSLGLERTTPGAVVGWVKGQGDNYIDFGIFTDENREQFHDFMTGREGALLLDFNVDGVVFDKI